MRKTVLNKENQDTTKEPLFLGKDLSLQRFDRLKYPEFEKLMKQQWELFWTPFEISLTKDRNDFKNLSPVEQRIFTKNLQFQTLMDSVISRGIPELSHYVSNPELESCMSTWQFFENIHSYSYTYIIQNIYSNPTEILDECLKDKEILARCDSVSKEYDKLKNPDRDIKDQIYLTLISVNILEAIRFYVSFVCAFWFGDQKKMIGNADIIKKIRSDEAKHLSITQSIINILIKEKSEGFQDTIRRCESEGIDLFKHAVNEEKAWCDYLFKDGSLLGLNSEIMYEYIEWLADTRMKAIGLPTQYNVKQSPIRGWATPWFSSESVQVAPQESEITSYKISASTNDLDDIDFSDV